MVIYSSLLADGPVTIYRENYVISSVMGFFSQCRKGKEERQDLTQKPPETLEKSNLRELPRKKAKAAEPLEPYFLQ